MNKTFLPIECNKTNCPHHSYCCRVPTEVNVHEGRNGIDILIFGMGAGKDEERLRRCFVGRAGKYMRAVIKHIWDSSSIFNLAISNNVRFHPMDELGKDREPTAEEIGFCIEHLIKDINTLNPRVIIPVGRNATRTFLNFPEEATMGKMRGTYTAKIGEHERIINPTYHPSFLCRNYGSFKPKENNLYDGYFITDILKSL